MNIYTKQQITKRNKQASKKLVLNQRSLNNPNEIAFKYILESLGIKYVWQKPFWDSQRYVCVDFYLNEFKTVIEIDGSSHKKKKDLNRTKYLLRYHNIKEVIRFENHEVRNKRMYVIKNLLNTLYK